MNNINIQYYEYTYIELKVDAKREIFVGHSLLTAHRMSNEATMYLLLCLSLHKVCKI